MKEQEKFECADCGCFYWVEDRSNFDCPNCESLMKLGFDETWDAILDNMIATEDEMRLVCNINGKRKSELDNVVSAKTEYHTIEQYIKFTH
tara:strand:+ start:213 stop:485 length:273 start_codon:yes stop_codon:yes gene_type:complete